MAFGFPDILGSVGAEARHTKEGLRISYTMHTLKVIIYAATYPWVLEGISLFAD